MEDARTLSDSQAPPGVQGRLGLALGILLAEYLLISLQFDAFTVSERGGIWSVAARAGAVAPLAVVFVTALLLLRRGEPIWVGLAQPRINRALLVVHVLSATAFFVVTAKAFGYDAAPPGPAGAWLSLFVVFGATTALSLIVALAGREVVGRAVSWSVLAAAAVGVLAWLAGQFTVELWSVLSGWTLTVVSFLLVPWFPDVETDLGERRIELRGFEVFVSSECSGLEGVGLIAVLLGAYLVAFRDRLRLPNALLLLPLGVVAVWLGNSVRVALLMLVGAFVDADLAYGGFHSKLGWVVFCFVTLAVAALAQHARFFRRAGAEGAEQFENPTAGFLVPALVLNGVALVTAMFAKDVDRLYGLRLLAAGAALLALRRYYADLPRAFSPLSLAVGALVGVSWVATASPAGELTDVDVHWTWLATRVAGSVLVVPVVEELAFRGCLLRWFVSRDFTKVPFTQWTPWAVLASSLIFGLLHERWFAATLVGGVYAALQLRRGRILDAIAAHAATNAVVSFWAVWTGDLGYWS